MTDDPVLAGSTATHQRAHPNDWLVAKYLMNLLVLVNKALKDHGMDNSQLALLCINAENCENFVDELLLNVREKYWKEFPDRREDKVILCLVRMNFFDFVKQPILTIKEEGGILWLDIVQRDGTETILQEINKKVPNGFVRCVALDQGGCSVYDLEVQ